MCGNKKDLYIQQKVPDEDGENYANKIGAFFQITSASSGFGINELFFNIGKALLDTNRANIKNQSSSSNSKKIKLDKKQFKDGKKKRKCC